MAVVVRTRVVEATTRRAGWLVERPGLGSAGRSGHSSVFGGLRLHHSCRTRAFRQTLLTLAPASPHMRACSLSDSEAGNDVASVTSARRIQPSWFPSAARISPVPFSSFLSLQREGFWCSCSCCGVTRRAKSIYAQSGASSPDRTDRLVKSFARVHIGSRAARAKESLLGRRATDDREERITPAPWNRLPALPCRALYMHTHHFSTQQSMSLSTRLLLHRTTS